MCTHEEEVGSEFGGLLKTKKCNNRQPIKSNDLSSESVH